MTAELIGKFVMYVLAFWGLWKTFDTAFHFFFPTSSCSKCSNKDREIQRLQKEVKEVVDRPVSGGSGYLRNRLKQAEEQVTVWRRRSLEQIALKRLNTCSPDDLEEIYGCGPVTAQKLIRSRPLNTLEEANGLIPGRSIQALLNWAESLVNS